MPAGILSINNLLGYRDVAIALNYSEENVRRLVMQKKIGHLKIGGRVRFKPEHLAAFVKEVPAATPATTKPAASRARSK